MFSWAIRLPSLLRQRPLRAASRALIVYLDLFLAQVHLDGFLVPGDPLSDTDLLFEHDLLGDNDLLLEDLHDHLVLADLGFGSLCSERPKQGGHAAQADASPKGLPLQSGTAAALGGVFDVDLFAPHVLLDDLGVLHHVLAEADLFLGHGALVDHDLFLGDGHGHLVLADLGFGRLAFDGHPLDRYFLVLGRDLDLLAVGPYALADLHGAGLTLAGTGPELLLRALDPELVLVFEGYLTIVIEGRPVLDGALGL